MTAPWQIKIYENKQLVHSAEVDGAVILGRQSDKEPGPYFARKDGDLWRVVIARLGEIAISRRHVRIDPLDDERLRLTNLSQTLAVRFPDGKELKPGDTTELDVPIVMALDRKTIRIQSPERESDQLFSLVNATAAPGSPAASAPKLSTIVAQREGTSGLNIEEIVTWLQAAMDVLQAAAGSSDFFQKAARAVVELVDMDTGRVLVLRNGEWSMEAVYTANSGTANLRGPSQSILGKLLREKRTFWQMPTGSAMTSLTGVESVVAAPILNKRSEIIGAVYGERRVDMASGPARSVSRLEAMLVELLAGGVAAGLARVEQEQLAMRSRVQFEQFFTPELSHYLAAQPDLLNGREAEVSVLFCDIRSFSRFSERLGPARTVAWVSDVMEAMSECVLRYQGVVVDYIGDELIAMWGAPAPQADHPVRASKAARDMLAALPGLNERWRTELGDAMTVGIGINSGTARVGNTGTQRKFKYGPLGNTVNLASRVQGATKYLKTPVLITEATRTALDASFALRRVATVRVINIEEPVKLFELVTGDQPGWEQLKSDYEQALTEFENKEYRAASGILGNLMGQQIADGPSLVLLSRAVTAMIEGPSPTHPVWELTGK
jgi:adenylate cyclase